MARITWTDRANSGANSAISASIFNDLKASVNNLYTELENIINLSGSEGDESKVSRGGTTNYITPAAIYNVNDENSYIDLGSNGIISTYIKNESVFSLSTSGKTVTIGGPNNDWSTTVRGDITASGNISSSKIVTAKNIHVPGTGSVIKVGDDSTYIFANHIQSYAFTSVGSGTSAGTFVAGTGTYTGTTDLGQTQIELLSTDEPSSDPTNPHTANLGNRIYFKIGEGSPITNWFDESFSRFLKEIRLNTVDYGSINHQILVRDTSDNDAVKYINYDDLGIGSGGVTNAFTTASVIGGLGIYTASAAFDRIRFSPYAGIHVGITEESIYDGLPIITVGTASNFTSSWAINTFTASFAITSSFATSASQAISSSYALSASYAPIPTWNQVLSEGSNAAQDIFINENNVIYLGTTSDEAADASKIYHDSTTEIGDLRIETNNNKNIILDTANSVGIGENTPDEKLDIGGNLKVQGAISASTLPATAIENTVVVHENGVLKSREFSSLLGENSINGYATASFGTAGEITATSSTSSFQFGFGSGLSGSIQSGILTIETSSNFVATLAITANTASYILADNIDQPFSNLYVTGDITASIISASTGITSSDVYIDDWGSVSASLAAAVNSNDNLGNHTATEDLNLATFDIFGVTDITASGVISASGGFIGDLTGTASYADYATSASYSISASHAEFAATAFSATTASHALNANIAISASYVADALYSASIDDATITYYQFDEDTFVHTVNNVVTSQTASYVLNAVSASFATTASYVSTSNLDGIIDISDQTNLVAGTNLTLDDDTINLDDNINLTSVTASILGNVEGNLTGTASYADQATSSSYATTASYVENAQTASYVENAQTSSYVENAQTASYVETAQTASYVLQAVSASYASTASYVTTAQTASYFDIEFGSTNQGTLTASINNTETYVDLGVQITDNVIFNDVTSNGTLLATGATVKFTGIPNNPSVLTPLVIDSTGRIYTGSEYAPAGGAGGGGTFEGFTASGDFGGNFPVIAGAVFNIAGGNGITTTKTGTYQLTIDADGLLSSSGQIASEVSGAFNAVSSSIASDIDTNVTNIATNTSNISTNTTNITALQNSASVGIRLEDSDSGFSISSYETASFVAAGGSGLTVNVASDTITYTLNGVLSSSQQIATDISGAIDAATGSVLNDYGLISSSQQIATEISGAINSATSSVLNDYGLLSGSAQIATDISGAINSATSSVLNDYGLLSGSAQIATEISGAFNLVSSSIATDITLLEASASAGIFFANTDDPGFSLSLTETASFLASGDAYDNGIFDVVVDNNEINYSLSLNSLGLLSSSQQIATDISGAIDAATGSVLMDYGLLSSSAQIASDISGALSSIADNLGNHIAEMDLEMGDGATNYNINNVNNQNVFGTLSIESTGEILMTSTNKISFNNDNNNTFIRANSDVPEDLEIHADQDILLQPDNNVGIGTSSPSEKLHVGGNVRGTTFLSTGGSGTTPSFRFSADTDTGLYLAAPGILALQVGPSATGEFSLSETTATFNVDTTINGNLTASGDISASGYLHAEADNSNGSFNHVVVYDTGSGRFYYTGSYGTGGSTGAGDANVLALENNTSNVAFIGTIPIDSTHTYMRAEFYAKDSSLEVQAARTVFIWDQQYGTIHATTVEDIRTNESLNIFNINSVSGSWDGNGDIQVYLTQYNGLTVDYKFRYILI